MSYRLTPSTFHHPVRLDIKDPQQLVPQLPKPRDLQPFPTTLAMEYTGHQGAVHSVAPDPWTGQWLLSGGQDGTMRLWEVGGARRPENPLTRTCLAPVQSSLIKRG